MRSCMGRTPNCLRSPCRGSESYAVSLEAELRDKSLKELEACSLFASVRMQPVRVGHFPEVSRETLGICRSNVRMDRLWKTPAPRGGAELGDST